jgi:hypothetical protein
MVKTSQELPVGWIKVWIGIGIAALFVLLMIPALFSYAVEIEKERYLQCQLGKRTDCAPSAIWASAGLIGEKAVAPTP